ncbi:dynein regulatory complex subunit 3 [Ricinus communis]|uniref:dynein regulatory complex subunit 3 n=1 Tax=Ricinus communis TaxID=3988 RepID=UPI00201A90EE|nr:dynein regulatory complex subunit 3 [Ricinus communis]
MGKLSMEQILKDKQSGDPNSISSLSLTQKALSEVSCLTQFTNLERLDLAFNSLTSLEGLCSCINLKWLSVVQNKLLNLKGIEALYKLTVLNAGKNKLKSMDEVRSLVSLRALILNDNDIVSICKLDQLKELNTLVLSRNPIREIGESLVKVKSLTKLSLSYCQLQTIGSSLKSCIELKELRLAHNDIKSLPVELSYNKNLQNLDLGNNVITRWSDVKVLSSIVDLKNLNLQGNPISEIDKLSKKILKLLPNLHIFNARPLDKGTKKGGSGRIDDFSLIPVNELAVPREKQKNSLRKIGHDYATDAKTEKDLKKKNKKVEDKLSEKEDVPVYEGGEVMVEKKLKRKLSLEQDDSNDLGIEDGKQKRKKANEEFSKKDVQVDKDDYDAVKRKSKSKKSKEEQDELDVIDDGDTPFADLFAVNTADSLKVSGEKKMLDKGGKDINLMGGVVTVSGKKKKTKNRGAGSIVQLPAVIEVGMGGPSTWGDE